MTSWLIGRMCNWQFSNAELSVNKNAQFLATRMPDNWQQECSTFGNKSAQLLATRMLRFRPSFAGLKTSMYECISCQNLMYHQIQQLSGERYSLNKISGVTGLHWRTIKKYLSMTGTEFEELQNSLSDRKKQLLPYEGFVKERLEMYLDTCYLAS